MPRVTDLFGLATAACLTAAAALALPGAARLRKARPLLAAAAALVLALVPLGGLPVAGYVRGVLGDLSVTTTLLLLHHLLRPGLGLAAIDARSRVTLQALVATGGVVLYPLALGFGPTDPYRLGFADGRLVGLVLVAAVGAWIARLHFVASVLALSVVAWAAGLAESRNLWDYLLDPLVAAWGLVALLLRLTRRAAARAAD